VRVDRETGNDRPLDEPVGIEIHDAAVFEGPRLALVGVDDEVDLVALLLVEEAPLHAGGESRAATAANVRLLDLFAELGRFAGRQGSPGRLVRARTFGVGELPALLDAVPRRQ
jgi:hypothetical protein